MAVGILRDVRAAGQANARQKETSQPEPDENEIAIGRKRGKTWSMK